jgi:hypothetical protein
VWLDVVKDFAALIAIVLAVALRFLAMWRGWKSPVARDYSEHVTRLPRRILEWIAIPASPAQDEADTRPTKSNPIDPFD